MFAARHAMIVEAGWRIEAPSVGGRHKLGRPLARAIGIVAAEPVGLVVRSAVGMGFVALVARDQDQHAGFAGVPHRV